MSGVVSHKGAPPEPPYAFGAGPCRKFRRRLARALCTLERDASLMAAFFVALSLGLAPPPAISQSARTAPAGASTPAVAPPVAAIIAPKTPEEFFARARQLSDLKAAGIPFHLKANYVAAGEAEFTGQGTYEIWWETKDDWRVDATLESFHYVAFRKSGELAVFASGHYVPLRLRQAMRAVLISIPESEDTSQSWKLRSKKMQQLDGVLLSGKSPCGRFQCLDAGYFTQQGVLRVTQSGSLSTIYNGIQPFEGHLVPREIWTVIEGQRVLAITVSLLEPLPVNSSSWLQSPANLQSLQQIPTLQKNEKASAGRLLQAPAPTYPIEAKQKRIQGTVLVDASIDSNGDIREPYIRQSAGSELDQAALQTIRRWHYQPAEIDGKPIQVQTTLGVIFKLR
jgi:TonB family protein